MWKVDVRREIEVSGRLNSRRYVARKKELERELPLAGLDRMEVRAVRPTRAGARVAVKVTFFYQPGQDAQPGRQVTVDRLNEGERTSLGPGTYVTLEKRGERSLRRFWWALLLIISAVLVWFGVFFLVL